MSQVEPVEMRRSGGEVSRGEVKSRYVSLVEVRRAGSEVRNTVCVAGRIG